MIRESENWTAGLSRGLWQDAELNSPNLGVGGKSRDKNVGESGIGGRQYHVRAELEIRWEME